MEKMKWIILGTSALILGLCFLLVVLPAQFEVARLQKELGAQYGLDDQGMIKQPVKQIEAIKADTTTSEAVKKQLVRKINDEYVSQANKLRSVQQAVYWGYRIFLFAILFLLAFAAWILLGSKREARRQAFKNSLQQKYDGKNESAENTDFIVVEENPEKTDDSLWKKGVTYMAWLIPLVIIFLIVLTSGIYVLPIVFLLALIVTSAVMVGLRLFTPLLIVYAGIFLVDLVGFKGLFHLWWTVLPTFTLHVLGIRKKIEKCKQCDEKINWLKILRVEFRNPLKTSLTIMALIIIVFIYLN